MGRERNLHVVVLLLSGSQYCLQFASESAILFSKLEAKAETLSSEACRRRQASLLREDQLEEKRLRR
jgi:hypothetical protein